MDGLQQVWELRTKRRAGEAGWLYWDAMTSDPGGVAAVFRAAAEEMPEADEA